MNPAYDILNNNPASPAGLCFINRSSFGTILGPFWRLLTKKHLKECVKNYANRDLNSLIA